MRVLAYLLSYPPYRFIGSELMTARLLEELAAAGHDVTVVVEGLHRGGEYVRRGVHVVPRRPLLMAHDLSSQFDLVVSHPELGEYLFPRAKGIPYIAVVHNVRDAVIKGMKVRRPNHAVYNSDRMAETLDAIHRIPYTVIYPPVSPASRTPKAGMPRQFVTAVNLTKDKGGDMLWWFAEQRPQMQFLAVLGGYGEQIVHEDRGNVFVLGQSPDLALPWSMSKVAVFPSLHESFGMAAVEAAAAGVPVIMSDLPGPREALGDAATYVDPEDAMGWLTALDVAWAGSRAVNDAGVLRGKQLADRTAKDMARWVDLAESVASGG